MRQDYEMINLNLNRNGASSAASASSWLGRVLTFGMGVLLLVVGLVFSLLVFALAATAAVLIIGFVWWKTREQRRQMRAAPTGGRIIDGESVRETRR
ncbi:MAG TPA: hypothetical protein VN664_11525 [Burkholderiales bacterium]|nr:hypothetical protein [Burkholderiales bacterium]